MFGAKDPNIYFRCQAAALPHDYDASTVPARRAAATPPVDAPRYLYVGRISPEKGLDTLLHAFVQVLRTTPKAELVLVGGGPITDQLRALAAELGIAPSVVFAGSMDVDALRGEYLRATCFVLPSTSEPWGLVVNEALSYGCPVVVSHRCGCVPELVLDDKTGYVFEASNAADLAEKMSKVLTTFADPLATATRCLSVISAYCPEAAARQILEGCQDTVQRLRKHA
jgi:glycosyltransferase involved in cell wall biosynthesis